MFYKLSTWEAPATQMQSMWFLHLEVSQPKQNKRVTKKGIMGVVVIVQQLP